MEKVTTATALEYFGISDIGLIRKTNQDIWECDLTHSLFVLADGMGGHKGGEVAAAEAVHAIIAYIQQQEPSIDLYKKAIREANRVIYEKARTEKRLEGMGTTVALLAFQKDKIIIAHVGDSRIYRLRDHELLQLTEDHSLAQELISLGTIEQDDTQIAPFKNVLTRALGTYPQVEADLQMLSRESKDLYMLCSDGLTNYVSDENIKKILLSEISLQKRAEELVALAKQQGGGDNITLLLVKNHDLLR